MWTKINSDDPIYNTNYHSIDDYIHSLKLIYQEKTGCTWEQTELSFKKNCPELTPLANLIKSFNNKDTPSTASLRIIIKTPNWDARGKHKAAAIIALLGTLKLPIYGETKQLPSIPRISTIPENMNLLLRELQFQKITLEAIAKKQIAEANLLAVINLLAKFIPSEIDLNELLSQYNIVLSELQEIDESNSLIKIK